MRVAVIGAGPIGIAAAIEAAGRGHEVTLLEREEPGASLRAWGRTRFFTPFSMNVSARMRELLGAHAPEDDVLMTGPEFVERVLEPLTRSEPLRGRIRSGHRVVAISRRGMTRGDYAAHPLRAERPFRIICETGSEEKLYEADAILDASGGLTLPRAFGAGGIPPLGMQKLTVPPIRTLGELEVRRDELRGRTTLLVGGGHSAANAIAVLEQIAISDPATLVVWAVRSANRRPCEEIPGDPLPERRRVVEKANALAEAPPAWLRVERRALVERVSPREVTLSGNRVLEVERIAAFTGGRPDGSFVTELPLEISPVTEGGARLYRAISSITDCLSVPALRPADLESGEPGYSFIGARAWGRARTFLLQTGLAQMEAVVSSLSSRED